MSATLLHCQQTAGTHMPMHALTRVVVVAPHRLHALLIGDAQHL